MSLIDHDSEHGFPINLGVTTEIIGRLHTKLMVRSPIDWDALHRRDYDDQVREKARREWASRAVAEYYSTSQFSQLTHRLCVLGAPIELIGASTRLATDECRHAELCTRIADALGGRQGINVGDEQLSVYDDVSDPWLAVYLSILQLCCFGETLSVPMLRAVEVVTNDPTVEVVAGIIAADEGYHMNFGWEALQWMTPRLEDDQLAQVRDLLPRLIASFEIVCQAGPEVLDSLAGSQLVVEQAKEPNLGILSAEQYAAIFYHCMQAEILPRLTKLGFDSEALWKQRLVVTNA